MEFVFFERSRVAIYGGVGGGIVYIAISKCDRRKEGTPFARTRRARDIERERGGEEVRGWYNAVSRTFSHRPRDARKISKKGKA